MFNLLSLTFRYIFIFLIYLFMIGIIRLIYLDIRSIRKIEDSTGTYLKLITRRENIPFKIEEEYFILNSLSIGRGQENDIVLRNPYVSKEHGKIFKEDNVFYLRDNNSSNGTYVNNDKVKNLIKLGHGDRIKIGQIEFLFVDDN